MPLHRGYLLGRVDQGEVGLEEVGNLLHLLDRLGHEILVIVSGLDSLLHLLLPELIQLSLLILLYLDVDLLLGSPI